jgi:hypothetical protein
MPDSYLCSVVVPSLFFQYYQCFIQEASSVKPDYMSFLALELGFYLYCLYH